jgi:hypothetical protein
MASIDLTEKLPPLGENLFPETKQGKKLFVVNGSYMSGYKAGIAGPYCSAGAIARVLRVQSCPPTPPPLRIALGGRRCSRDWRHLDVHPRSDHGCQRGGVRYGKKALKLVKLE